MIKNDAQQYSWLGGTITVVKGTPVSTNKWSHRQSWCGCFAEIVNDEIVKEGWCEEHAPDDAVTR